MENKIEISKEDQDLEELKKVFRNPHSLKEIKKKWSSIEDKNCDIFLEEFNTF